jgi:glycosyltransferase involved in cell wall biosynthesis
LLGAEAAILKFTLMTLAIIAIDYPPVLGGISRYTGDIVHFISRDRDVLVYLCADHEPAPWSGHPHHGVINPGELVRDPASIAARLKSDGVDHVMFNHIDMAGPRTVWAFRKAGIPCSCFFYGADINLRRPVRHHLRLYVACALMRNRIVISHGTRAIFHRRAPGLTTRMVFPGIQSAGEMAASPRPGDGIIAVGRLVRRKGFDVLCDALIALRHDKIHPRLTIVGDGPDADWLKKRVLEQQLDRHVRFLSGLSDDEIRAELRAHRVFCLLPRSLDNGDVEGFGIVFLEAAREGLPVIAGRSGGVPDAVADGRNGYLVDPMDATAVARSLKMLLTDDELWLRQSRESIYLSKQFAWTNRDSKREFAFLDGSD